MKKLILFLAFTGPLLLAGQTEKNLSKILELTINGEGGKNGGSVAYHPVQKKYYAGIAGNKIFPMGVYDLKGKLLSPDELEAMFDLRGLWYNPKSKAIQANGFKEFGWAQYTLDARGIPASVKILQAGMNQPDSQNVAAYNPTESVLYFLNYASVDKYDYADGKFLESINLFPGQTGEDDDELAEEFGDLYNLTTIIYTGTPGSELGLLNVYDKQVELYNSKTGYMTRKLKLPDDAPTFNWMNFSFCNGIYWLFDKDNRKWIGYK